MKLKSYFSHHVKWCRTSSSEIFWWNVSTLPNFKYVSVSCTWKHVSFLNIKRAAFDSLLFSYLCFYILRDYHKNKYKALWMDGCPETWEQHQGDSFLILLSLIFNFGNEIFFFLSWILNIWPSNSLPQMCYVSGCVLVCCLCGGLFFVCFFLKFTYQF